MELRLLISFLSHLKTDPVVVTCLTFSQACAIILCFLSFIMTNICLIRTFSDVNYERKSFNELMDNVDKILQDETTEVPDLKDEHEAEAEDKEDTQNGDELVECIDEHADLIEA